MIAKIATAGVYVDDQEQAVHFWVEQVGFRIHCEQTMGPNAKWIEVDPAETESCLVIYPNAMMKDWAERKPSIVFECQDIQQTYQAVTGRGVQFTQSRRTWPGAGSPFLWTRRAIGMASGKCTRKVLSIGLTHSLD